MQQRGVVGRLLRFTGTASFRLSPGERTTDAHIVVTPNKERLLVRIAADGTLRVADLLKDGDLLEKFVQEVCEVPSPSNTGVIRY